MVATGSSMGPSMVITTVTPSSALNTASTLQSAQPSTGQYLPNTYHIFLQTTQPNIQPYFPGGAGLLQAATAWPGAPNTPPYFNIGMIQDPAAAFFQQPGFKQQSSGRGGAQPYKNRRGTGGGGRGGGRDNDSRSSSQNSYTTNYNQSGYGSQPPFNNHNSFQPRSNNGRNWETSSQHSNSSQGKKYSGGSDPAAPVPPAAAPINRMPQQPPAAAPQYQPSQYQPAPRPQGPPKEAEQTQYYPNQYSAGRPPVDGMQSKDFSRRGGKGRETSRGGGSGRGRSGEDYLPSGRGGGMMGGPPRGQSFTGPRSTAQQEPVPPSPRPDVKPPEFNMKTNDFPALPGSGEAGQARRGEEDRPFLEVVKGTRALRLEDGEEAGSGEEEEATLTHHTEIPEDSSHKQSILR